MIAVRAVGFLLITSCSADDPVPPCAPGPVPQCPKNPIVARPPTEPVSARTAAREGKFPLLPDLEASQYCAFTKKGMMAQSLIVMNGDLAVGSTVKGPRAVRWLVNWTCSFESDDCSFGSLWIDQIDHQGNHQTVNQLQPDLDKSVYKLTHGRQVATIQDHLDTWTIDAVAGRVTYVHESSTARGEGPCVKRAPPMFEAISPDVAKKMNELILP